MNTYHKYLEPEISHWRFRVRYSLKSVEIPSIPGYKVLAFQLALVYGDQRPRAKDALDEQREDHQYIHVGRRI